MKPKTTKGVKLTKVEKAILYLAEMMEVPDHDQYYIKKATAEILGYTPIK